MSKNWDDDRELMEYNHPYCPYCRNNPNSFDDMYRPMHVPPFGPPGNKPNQEGPPLKPPPSKTPKKESKASVYKVDPGAIKPCVYRYVYLWMKDGREFWAWLVYVGPTSVAGYRWTGYNWRYFGTDLKNIESFECY